MITSEKLAAMRERCEECAHQYEIRCIDGPLWGLLTQDMPVMLDEVERLTAALQEAENAHHAAVQRELDAEERCQVMTKKWEDAVKSLGDAVGALLSMSAECNSLRCMVIKQEQKKALKPNYTDIKE